MEALQRTEGLLVSTSCVPGAAEQPPAVVMISSTGRRGRWSGARARREAAAAAAAQGPSPSQPAPLGERRRRLLFGHRASTDGPQNGNRWTSEQLPMAHERPPVDLRAATDGPWNGHRWTLEQRPMDLGAEIGETRDSHRWTSDWRPMDHGVATDGPRPDRQ